MAKSKSTAASPEQITDVLRVTEGSFECCLVGTSGFVNNRMSQKAERELLFPHGRKTAAERALSLKHVPLDEYRASPYTFKDPKQPTLLAHLATAFKSALRNAALDVPGMKKSQIGRLTYVVGDLVGIYGVPQLYMSVVRSADMNHTPDIRTRAICPEWACRVRINFAQQLIRAQAVANLLATAGITNGVGDGRPEKGALSFGRFRIADPDDAEFKRIVKEGGRKAQLEAMERPVCYDDETTELLGWFTEELSKRTLKGVA
jgi:hypothetical protein